jgi:hypothetical protein
VIEVRFSVVYKLGEELGALGEFVIDLNPTCVTALAVVRYEPKEGASDALFKDVADSGADAARQRLDFFKSMRERVPVYYEARLFAEDPNDAANRKQLEWSRLSSVIRADFINAQRGLDDTTHRDNDVLGKVLTALFKTASAATADPKDRETVERLESAIHGIEEDLGEKVSLHLNSLLPAFKLFGYPSFPDPNLLTETSFDAARLLANHTRIRYPGANGINLPEAYNGLGTRNLIFMLLKLHAFFKAYCAARPATGIHLVFIEEPEAHLHPQMQEVFIEKLSQVGAQLTAASDAKTVWPVQFIVTTHSSHVANRAPFRAVRYFLTRTSVTPPCEFPATTIKDLGAGFGGPLKESADFLHKYMTLTRCDLLFADKAILIEGTSERLLFPKMIELVDAGKPPGEVLSSQYVTTMEVGGAHAHLFFGLLDFLEVPSLIVTDLDSVKQNTSGDYVACPVSEGARTSNACINKWFAVTTVTPAPAVTAVTPAQLLAKSDADKTLNGRRLAYQVPEVQGSPCGRSLEQAFMLANPTRFGLGVAPTERDSAALAAKQKKSDFALGFAIEQSGWRVPRYIAEGLAWLAAYSAVSTPLAASPVAATIAPVGDAAAPTLAQTS